MLLKVSRTIVPVLFGLFIAVFTANLLMTIRLWFYHKTSFFAILLDTRTKGLIPTLTFLFIICVLIQLFLIKRLREHDFQYNRKISLRTIVIFSILSFIPGLIVTLSFAELEGFSAILIFNLIFFIDTLVYFTANYFMTVKLENKFSKGLIQI